MFTLPSAETLATTNEVLAALRTPPPAAVREWEDASFTSVIAPRLASSPVSPPRVDVFPTPLMAEAWIREILRAAAEQAPPSSSRTAALAPDASIRTLLRALTEAPLDIRLDVAGRIARATGRDRETVEFLGAKFDNVVASIPLADRAVLGCELLAEGRDDTLCRLLRASDSLDHLSQLIHALDPLALTARSAPLREYVALATVLPALRQIDLGADTGNPDVDAATVRRGLSEALRMCLASGPLADTATIADIQRAIVDDLMSLDRDLSRTSDPTAQREVINLARAAAAIELRYGVDITTGPGEDLITSPRAEADPLVWPSPRIGDAPPSGWRLKDLVEIERVLAGLNEGRLLMTDLLHRIEFVDTLGENVLGARYHDDGRIKIAAVALDHAGISAAVHNISSLVFVLTHEIGHSFQIGRGETGYTVDNGRFDFAPGEPSIDFKDFATLSGWQVIDPARVAFGPREGTIVLDGSELPLGRPVLHGGRWIVLFGESTSRLLVAVDATAEFSERWYSRTSPWEDFAEAFAYYHACPEALIMDAPLKFMHLDEELRRYVRDERLDQLLDASLRLRGKVR